MSFWYLASPYTRYRAGIDEAYRDVCNQAAILIKAGINVFSPISHSHGIAIHGEIDALDCAMWIELDRPFMDAACGLIVCELDGWDQSEGVRKEIDYFVEAGKPIIHMKPFVIPLRLLSPEWIG